MPNPQPVLENQISFKLYALNRLIQKAYQPHLQTMGITYPQYLAMMVLWEEDGQTVNEIARRLLLESNTVTPILQRLEQIGLVRRMPGCPDARQRIVSLTEKGLQMQAQAAVIPDSLADKLSGKDMDCQSALSLSGLLDDFIRKMVRCR